MRTLLTFAALIAAGSAAVDAQSSFRGGGRGTGNAWSCAGRCGDGIGYQLACMLMCVLVSRKAFAGGLLCLVAYALIERRRAAALLDESIRQDTLDTEERAALALAWLASVLTGLTPRLFAGLLLGAAIALLHAVLRDGAPAVRKQRRRWWGR